MKSNGKKITTALKGYVKDFFTKRVVLKIVSLLFAMLLWGYVLMTQDPERIKSIPNVSVSIEGEADLLARKLTIVGDKSFETVAVKVRTQLTQYADLGADDITATINLAGITQKGTYELTVTPKSSTGTATGVTPARVSVTVDDLVTRRVPVDVELVGELPDGYWCGNLSVARSEIEIEGAAETIASIQKATAQIDLSNCVDSINRSILLTLHDAEGNTVDSGSLLGTLPTVAVKLDVLNMKEVPVDITGALLGADNLPVNFELMSCNIVSGPTSVRLVGDKAVLDGIDSVALEPIDISGSSESVYNDFSIIVPEGLTLLDEDTVTLYADIREKNASTSFVDINIEARGLGRKLNARLSQPTVNITISGRISLINTLERDDVKVYVDLTDYTQGTYETPLYIELPSEEMMVELEKTLSTQLVSVVVE